MSLYNKFATDKQAETEGIILEYGDGVKVRINRASGAVPRFAEAVRKFMPNIAKDGSSIAYSKKTIDQERAMALVLAHGILLEWEGVTDQEGKELPFTTDNVVKVLTDLPDFASDIMDRAMDAENFNAAKIKAYKEALGNG